MVKNISKRAKEYMDWLQDNKELVTGSSLFLNCWYQYTRNDSVQVKWAPDQLVLFPGSIVQCNKVQVSELPELFVILSKPYSELINKAQNLPAGKVEGSFLYEICDALMTDCPYIPEYDEFNIIYRDDDDFWNFSHWELEEPPRKSPNPYYEYGYVASQLARTASWAHAILIDISDEKKKSVFNYTPGDKSAYPTHRLTDLIKKDIFTNDELLNIGENIQGIICKIRESMTYEFFNEAGIPGASYDQRVQYAHLLKNTAHSLDFALYNIQDKLDDDELFSDGLD